ncbi:metal ABC transporter solute-binding protein, Zn/Mn family [Effusibacillus consociatus]|uniref:Metal ABC transporter solute-binding protein, Zn/Mn family n=1 Tax=Effusibacillus consociatus TaxID=1117041 RepID=A0ABV9PY64_9BACL
MGMAFRKLASLMGVLTLTLGLLLSGCGTTETTSGNTSGKIDGKIKVTTTIGMITDIVKNVGGDHVEVTGLMGPGVDPHLYKASQGDIAKLKEADIIFYNGLNLEGKMADIFVKLSREKPAIAVTEYIPETQLQEPPDFGGHFDPHVWFDVKMWMKAVERVRDGLIEAAPQHKADFEKNTQQYLKQLEELDAYAKTQLAQIPKERRVLVTAHDAFNYFGRAYDLEVKGLQGISTDSEYGLKDVQNLVDLLVQRKIKAVFVESSVPKRAIEAVVEGAKAKNHQVTIGGELFSDAMGDPGTKEGTYIGMVRHNVDTIVSALK